MTFKEFILSNMSEEEIEKHYSGLAKLAKGLAKAAKEVHAFHMTEEDIQAAMKHKPMPEKKDESK